jgi:phage shock protein A
MSIWNKLMTAIRGGATEVGEAIVDQQALRILDQEIRDADAAVRTGRDELVKLIARHKGAVDRVEAHDRKITDLETKALAALDANREDLATEIAELIAAATTERDNDQALATEFGASVERMKKDLAKAETRIKSLRNQVDTAKARESVQRAQVSASVASGTADGKLSTAVDTLNRLQQRQEQRARELEAREEMAEAASGSDLDRRLREAGVIADPGSSNAVLERLKAQRGAKQP